MPLRRALLAGLVLLAGRAGADEPARLTLCLDSPRGERPGAELLQAWLPMPLALAGRGQCASSATRYRGWFEQRGASACFVLAGPGARRSRCMPWLRSARRPLSSLEASGQLATFSVVLQALVAEHELSWLLDSPPAPPSNGGARGEREDRPREQLVATLVALEKVRAEPPVARVGNGVYVPRATAPDQPVSTSLQRASELRGAGQGSVAKWIAFASSTAPAGSPSLAAGSVTGRGHGPPTDEPGAAQPRPRPVPPERRTRVVQTTTVEPAHLSARSIERSSPVTARRATRWGWEAIIKDLAIEAVVGGRWRSGDLWSVEVGGSLGWRSLFVRAGYQPASRWALQGRPIEVSSVPLAAGWRPRLWSRRSWRLRAGAALLVERFTLRRTDVPQSGDHSHWDVGMGAGLDLALRGDKGVSLAVEAGGFYFPGAREIEIQNGPSAKLTTLGARLAVVVAWEGR